MLSKLTILLTNCKVGSKLLSGFDRENSALLVFNIKYEISCPAKKC